MPIYGLGNRIGDLHIEGDTYQPVYAGVNVLNVTAASTKINGVTFIVNSDKSVTMFGTASANATFVLNTYSFVQGTQYTMSGSVGGYTSSQVQLWAQLDAAFPAGSRLYSANGNVITRTAAASGTGDVYIRVYSGTTINATYKPMIEIGSSHTQYEPYTSGLPAPNPAFPVPVSMVTNEQKFTVSDTLGHSKNYTVNLGGIGKNKFNIDAITKGFELSTAGVMLVNVNWWVSEYIPVKGNTTYTSTNVSSNMKCWYDSDKNFISQTSSATATSPSGAAYLRVNGTISSITSNPNAQIEEGSTATAYEAYRYISLYKLGTYQDYIYKSGDNWYVHKETGTVTYNGSENWTYQSQYSRCYVSLPSDMGSAQADYETTTKCSHFRPGRTTESSLDDVYFVGGTAVSFKATSIITSKANWTAWLGANNVTVYYGLSTPVNTQITDSSLIQQLEDLSNAPVYEQDTTITATGGLAAGTSYTLQFDVATKILKLYGSVNGQTKQINKVYGSVNGVTKRIF